LRLDFEISELMDQDKICTSVADGTGPNLPNNAHNSSMSISPLQEGWACTRWNICASDLPVVGVYEVKTAGPEVVCEVQRGKGRRCHHGRE
jgi:hypothetical protein